MQLRKLLELENDEWYMLLDLAAQTHQDIPIDIKEFLLAKKDWYKKIRCEIYKEDERHELVR